MTPTPELSEFERYRRRRTVRARNQRLMRNLPLAHRLASDRAAGVGGPEFEEYLLGQAMVGLVAAADSFEHADVDCRFGAYAEPKIAEALDRPRDEDAVEAAQAEIAAAITSEERVRELATFLDVPIEALVGGLMDAAVHDDQIRHRPLRGAA